MARRIQEIYDEMASAKLAMLQLNMLQPNIDSAQTFLQDITSASKVAVWRTAFFIMAVGIWSLEELFADHKAWIEKRAAEIRPGVLPWYRELGLAFQYGDVLIWDGKRYKYATVNPALQIVKLCSVNEVGAQVVMKIAKVDPDGIPEPLTVPELNAFKAYMKKVKIAGVVVSTISREPDLMKVHYKIYYDPLLMNASGELLSDPSIKPAEIAINNFIKGLPFDGKYTPTSQTDKLQQAIGIVDPVYQTAEVKYGTNPYAAIGDQYNPDAGYLKIDPAYPLSDTLTYIQA